MTRIIVEVAVEGDPETVLQHLPVDQRDADTLRGFVMHAVANGLKWRRGIGRVQVDYLRSEEG